MNEVKELVEELRNKKSRDNRDLLDKSADMIERLAKELCKKSGCHHKCHDTDKCVVEDEALLLITENKSNNFDVKSNEELFKQALVEGLNRHFDKTIEEAKKIEQIEEMARIINRANGRDDTSDYYLQDATDLYNAGYRKQKEGEWQIAVNPVEATFICSKCGYFYIEADPQAKTEYKYCPHCGSKMKGGE